MPLLESVRPTFQRPQNIGLQLKQLEVLPGADADSLSERRIELLTPEGTVINKWQVINSPEFEAENEQTFLALDLSAQLPDGASSLEFRHLS